MMNERGNFESKYATNSASNEYGACRRPSYNYIPAYPFPSNPIKHGTAMAYLIANEFISDGVSL